MKAQELRIGNYVLLGDNQIMELKSPLLSLILSKDADIERFKSIPLTEEWLLDFGFEKGTYHWILPNSNFYFGVTTHNKITPWFDTDYPIRIELKYVHQLQNLYFAITGEELTKKQ